jgi:hypothetical protein
VTLGVLLVAMLLDTLSATQQDAASNVDPFELVQPDVPLSHEDRQALVRGETIATTLEADARSHLVVFAASRLQTTPARFVDSMRDITQIWRGRSVPSTGIFSEPIGAEDVAAIRLTEDDLNAARRCKPGDCAIKLSDVEMARIGRPAHENGREWQARTQAAFRSVLLDRLQSYRKGGLSQLGPFHDHEETIEPHAVFTRLLADASIVKKHALQAVTYLERYPLAPLPPGTEDHLYWLETVQSPKPTLQALHQVIHRGSLESAEGGSAVEVVVVTRQIFATHYINGSIALTLLVRTRDGHRYMFYVNRISADGLGGWLPRVRRYFIERRIREAARETFTALTRKIELNADERVRAAQTLTVDAQRRSRVARP